MYLCVRPCSLTFLLKAITNSGVEKKSLTQTESPISLPAPPKPKTERQRIAEDFVKTLSKQPSHYYRSRSNRVYLTSEVKTKRELARSLNSWCAEKYLHPVPSEKILRKGLKIRNVSLFVPKKISAIRVCVRGRERIRRGLQRTHGPKSGCKGGKTQG